VRPQQQLVGLGIDLLARRSGTCCPDGVDVAGRRRSERTKSVCCGRLRSCCARSLASRLRGTRLVLWCVGIWWGRRTPVPVLDRRRIPAELLAANDELARLMLLEVSGKRAPAMLRGFPVPLTSGPKTKHSNPEDIEAPAGQKAR
jgi:hypothetical protein